MEALRHLYRDLGFKIVIFTQQMGISKGFVTRDAFVKKVVQVQKEVGDILILLINLSWECQWKFM